MSKPKKQTFKVAKEEAGLRLDVFLSLKLPDFSRSWIQKLIEKGNVRVGRRKPKAGYRLKKSENVFVIAELPPEISLEAEAALKAVIKVTFENDDFLVIEKAAGVVVHPSSATPAGTLVNWLLWRHPEIKKVGEDSIRPGIVHRLDKDTSGLMVVAKNHKTFKWLKEQFQERQVFKKYLALVTGEMEKDSGEITYPIGRAKRDPTKQAAYKNKSQAPPNAKQASTHWRVIKRFPGFTFLEVTPKTGRMHQIRVHLKSIGHPVVGDARYGSKSVSPPKHLGRMFLHASSLSFKAASGEKFSFTAPLPQELDRALKNLPFMLE